jgi:predicted phosphohydrolase
MRVFAVSDPHLSLATPGKSMAVFGPEWQDHPDRLADRWRERVSEEDLVIVAGDVSWAMRLEDALPDLRFLAGLPGRVVMVRGNHDYWWGSLTRLRAALPEGMYAIQNDVVVVDGVAVGGTRLWDDPEVRLPGLRPRDPQQEWDEPPPVETPERSEKILARELGRLRLSLDCLPADADLRIAAVHYPPTGTDLAPTHATEIIEAAGVRHCVFGHLHGLEPAATNPLFGEREGVCYWLTSCDYLDFAPIEIAELD